MVCASAYEWEWQPQDVDMSWAGFFLYRHYCHLYHDGTMACHWCHKMMAWMGSKATLTCPSTQNGHHNMSNNHQNSSSKNSSRRGSWCDMSRAPWALGSIFQKIFLFTRKSSLVSQILLFLLIFAYLGTLRHILKKYVMKKEMCASITKYHGVAPNIMIHKVNWVLLMASERLGQILQWLLQ